MNRFVVVFLSVACAFTSTVALSIDSLSSDSDGLIRLPLTPSPRKRRAAEDGVTKIEMSDTRDVRYGFPVDIGTPPQTLNVLLDTGSVDCWVPWVKAKSYDCDENCKRTTFFDEKKSSTFKNGPGDFRFGYKGGATSGTIGLDTFSFGGLTVENQPFGLADKGYADVEGFNGLVGFTYPAFSTIDNTTIFDKLKEQGKIKQLIGCVKMRQKKVAKSEFVIGGCDVEADAYAPVRFDQHQPDKRTGWRVTLTKIILRDPDDNSELFKLEPNYEAVLDTGAGEALSIPTKFLDPISKQMGLTPANGFHYLVGCDKWKNKKLPIIEFYFGDDGAKVAINQDIYSWPYFDECQVGIKDNGDGVFLLGTILFNAGTVIFDRENNQIGFKPF